MEKLSVPEPEYKEISHVIETDVNLTYKLLKLVNSRFSLNQNVSSIQHALSILGINPFRKWLSMVMIQNNASHTSSELVKISLIRSNFLENAANASTLKNDSAELSLIGLLSCIDVLLDSPMDILLKSLPLSQDIKDALLGIENKYTCIINISNEYEKGNFNNFDDCCNQIQLSPEILPQTYINAVKWAEAIYEYTQ